MSKDPKMKIATTGRILFGYLLFAAGRIFATCDIQVKALNQAGETVSEVAVGVPFQLQIIAKGDCDVSEVEFSSDFNICKISSLGTIKSVSNINHVMTHAITHRYMVRIDQPGSYTLGPIQLKHANNLVGTVNLAVNVQPIVVSKINPKNLTSELKINKQKVYAGERFEMQIRFYFDDLSIENVALNLPFDFKDKFDFEFIDQAVLGNVVQNGQKLQYLEWNLVVSARQAGEHLLPAIGVVFEKKQRINQFFIFQNHDAKEIFSNSVLLQILPLPKIDPLSSFANDLPGQVAVGVFTKFTAKINQHILKDGQAAQLILTLEGDGNWDKVKISLSQVPENLQSYAGMISQQTHSKSFEYVLQGVKSGICSLPKQKFIYFDPQAEKYKSLQTNAIELDVLSVPDFSKKILAENHENPMPALNAPIKPIIEAGSIGPRAGYYLPIWLFSFLLLLPALILILKAIFVKYHHKSQSGFKVFKKQLKLLASNQQTNLLYHFFTNILTQEFNLKTTQINTHAIDDMLATYGVLPEQIRAFGQFYNELAAAAFSENYKHSDLFKRAQDWLIFLEGVSDLKW